jgi:hypothetical protein
LERPLGLACTTRDVRIVTEKADQSDERSKESFERTCPTGSVPVRDLPDNHERKGQPERLLLNSIDERMTSEATRRALRPALVAAIALVTTAHVGSPNVIFDGMAGPYAVRVVVRPPEVIPGLADISRARVARGP